jgi:putative ABC transport system permease protein
LLARGHGDAAQLAGAIRKAVAGIDPALPVFRVRTLKEQAESIMAEERFMARLLLVFAAIAVMLAAAGIFGLISYNTERATHDFGIRIALGAQAHHVLWIVFRKGLLLAVAGSIVGLGAAFWLTRLLASLLFGVSPTDPVTFAAVAALAVLIALLACYLPARRATKIDPLIALRTE